MKTAVCTADESIVMYILEAVATDGGRPCLISAGLIIEPPPNPTVPPTKPPIKPIVKTGRRFYLV